jgi:hypothetical protein
VANESKTQGEGNEQIGLRTPPLPAWIESVKFLFWLYSESDCVACYSCYSFSTTNNLEISGPGIYSTYTTGNSTLRS